MAPTKKNKEVEIISKLRLRFASSKEFVEAIFDMYDGGMISRESLIDVICSNLTDAPSISKVIKSETPAVTTKPTITSDPCRGSSSRSSCS